MRTWIFALLQSVIATMGLAAYFLAENVILASSAVILAAALGVSQPLIAAHKQRRLKAYQDRQWDRSLDAVDEQLEGLLAEVIDPPMPHRDTVVTAMQQRRGDRATEQIERYDETVEAITRGTGDSQAIAAKLADDLRPWSLGPYLQGLAAMSSGDLAGAHQSFREATAGQTGWVLPWLGWATTAYRLGLWDELTQEHPHITGVQWMPYCAGDEATFMELSEPQREELSGEFQRAAVSLGNYYAIAEFCRSKQRSVACRDEFRKVA